MLLTDLNELDGSIIASRSRHRQSRSGKRIGNNINRGSLARIRYSQGGYGDYREKRVSASSSEVSPQLAKIWEAWGKRTATLILEIQSSAVVGPATDVAHLEASRRATADSSRWIAKSIVEKSSCGGPDPLEIKSVAGD